MSDGTEWGSRPGRHEPQVVHYGNYDYIAGAEATAIFLIHASALQAAGKQELVLLPHRGRVELLLVGAGIFFTTSTLDAEHTATPEPAARPVAGTGTTGARKRTGD